MLKKIFISQRVDIINNERRDSCSQEWNELAINCGFIPIFVPNNIKLLCSLLSSISPDGIILTGGNDLVEYNGNTPERDEVESLLIKYALINNLPLLGVCRGMQMILNYFNNKLVKVDNGDIVNSFHNWGCINCSNPLEVLAKSNDNCIEEIKYRKIRGIMWHPERYKPLRERDIIMIRGVLEL
ncbi:gamma-glutamyl-gamma-aminobutyrate hydrolase family protein [Fusobacterium polymorphum]